MSRGQKEIRMAVSKHSGAHASGVRVRTRRSSNIDREYMITPNALLRGEGVYAVLSSFGRLLLAAGLSCGDHETSLDEMRKWIPELGRTRHETLRRELREHGFLSLYRTIIPPGQPESGSFVWTFEFLMEPLPPEERDRLQERKPRPAPAARTPPPPKIGAAGAHTPKPSDGKTAGHTMLRNPEPLTEEDKTAGHTMLRKPGPGDPGPGVGGDVSKEEKNRSIKEPPPTPKAPEPAASVGEQREEGEDLESEEQTRIDGCVADVHRRRPGWSKRRITAAVLDAVEDGRALDVVIVAMGLVAADEATQVPGRLNQDGPWWALAEQKLRAAAPKPQWAWCDRHAVKVAEGAECPRCTDEAPNGAPGRSDGAGGASEIDDETLARLPERVRARMVGAVRA